MGLRFKGVQKAINSCDRMERSFGETAGATAQGAAEHLYAESQIQVPKKTGRLAASAFVKDIEGGGARRSSGVRYGDTALNVNGESYAAAVHEILKASHALPTKAKFVEDPLVQGVVDYKMIGIKECQRLVRKAFR